MKNVFKSLFHAGHLYALLRLGSTSSESHSTKKQYALHPQENIVDTLYRVPETILAQWEGFLADGRLVYIRFRNNTFYFHILEQDVMTYCDWINPTYRLEVASAGTSDEMDNDSMLEIINIIGYSCKQFYGDLPAGQFLIKEFHMEECG